MLPIGIPPRNATLYTLLTRPRMSLGVINWTSEVTIAKTAIIAAPARNRNTQLRPMNFDNAKLVMARPNAVSISKAAFPRFFLRPSAATISPPATDPQPRARQQRRIGFRAAVEHLAREHRQ